MSMRWRAGWIVVAVLAGTQSAATAGPFYASGQMTTIRIEPPRPGGLPGAPRETTPSRQFDANAALTNAPTFKHKRKRRDR